MHAILDVESDRRQAQKDQTLEERLVETSLCSLLIHDDRTQLLMITNQHNLLATKDQGNHAFGFGRLSRLINEHGSELHLGKTRITRANASAANNVGITENLALGSPGQCLEFLLILTRQ